MSASLRDDKFIISCAARTGSTLLQQLLRSQGDILCHGEVMSQDGVGPFQGPMHARRRGSPEVEERLLRYQREEPVSFLYDIVFDARGKRAVGFKFKTDEAFDPRFPHINRVQDAIAADTDIKVIRLRRRDILAQYISHQVVLKQTHQTMVVAGQERPQPKPFTADPGHVARYVLDVMFREERASRAYHGHRRIDVWYEDLAGDDPRVRGRVLRFLDVEEKDLSTDTTKVLADTRRLLENSDEAVATLETLGFPAGRYPEPVRA